MSEIGIQKDDAETSLNIVELFAITPNNMEDMVDMTHSTPPAMPTTTSHPMRPLSHIHSSASHGGSISLSLSESRSTVARSSQVPRPIISTARPLPFFDALPSESASLHPTANSQSGVDLWKPSSGNNFQKPPLQLVVPNQRFKRRLSQE